MVWKFHLVKAQHQWREKLRAPRFSLLSPSSTDSQSIDRFHVPLGSVLCRALQAFYIRILNSSGLGGGGNQTSRQKKVFRLTGSKNETHSKHCSSRQSVSAIRCWAHGRKRRLQLAAASMKHSTNSVLKSHETMKLLERLVCFIISTLCHMATWITLVVPILGSNSWIMWLPWWKGDNW